MLSHPESRLINFWKIFSKLEAHKIILKTRETIFIHIESESWMKELFNLRGLCGVCFKENG